MAMLIKYPDGSTRLIPKAVKVDQQNFHEGMYDFYDDKEGGLLEQISMSSGIKWELVDEPESQTEEIPLFLKKNNSEGQKGTAQDEKNESSGG